MRRAAGVAELAGREAENQNVSRPDEWPPAIVAQLRRLWAEGVPTTEIGLRIWASKNAVVGKAHRIGLPPRPSPIRSERSNANELRAPHGEATLPPLPAPSASTPEEFPMLTLTSIKPAAVPVQHKRGCLWPTWSSKDAAYWAAIRAGETLECGDPRATPSAVYCAAHRRAALGKAGSPAP